MGPTVTDAAMTPEALVDRFITHLRVERGASPQTVTGLLGRPAALSGMGRENRRRSDHAHASTDEVVPRGDGPGTATRGGPSLGVSLRCDRSSPTSWLRD